jgi:hypothetical protein
MAVASSRQSILHTSAIAPPLVIQLEIKILGSHSGDVKVSSLLERGTLSMGE